MIVIAIHSKSYSKATISARRVCEKLIKTPYSVDGSPPRGRAFGEEEMRLLAALAVWIYYRRLRKGK